MSDSDKKIEKNEMSEELDQEIKNTENEVEASENVDVNAAEDAKEASAEDAKEASEEETPAADKPKKRRRKKKKRPEEVKKPEGEKAKEENAEEAEASEDSEGHETEIIHLDEEEPGEESWEEKLEKRRKRKKAWKIVGIVFAVLVAIYLGISVFFMSHFYFGTKINGNNANAKSVKQMEAFMEDHVKGYTLTLQHSDGTSDLILGADIDISYKKSDALKKALKKQNPILWPMGLIKPENLEVDIDTEYNKEALTAILSELPFMNPETQVPSESAKPEFDGTQFVVKAETLGTQLDAEKFDGALDKYIRTFRDTLVLADEGCYLLPTYTKDSPEVAAACDNMNNYLKASVTYDFTPHTEVVDAALISTWLTVDENMNVVFLTDAVNAYVQSLADKYDTSGKPRQFVTANGNTVTVENGVYGWKINKEEEYNTLVANIQAGEVVTREPVYSRKAISHEGNDFGNTYAEVDLSGQHMWFIKNGQIVMDSPIVTGNPNKGNATPQGTYTLTYKQKGAVLRGPKQPDGSYEWESPVDFWMPFNGGIGFHDANWQSAFGGTRYKTHGSHGCINMPHEKAKQLFGYIEAGTPVICHY